MLQKKMQCECVYVYTGVKEKYKKERAIDRIKTKWCKMKAMSESGKGGIRTSCTILATVP